LRLKVDGFFADGSGVRAVVVAGKEGSMSDRSRDAELIAAHYVSAHLLAVARWA
jgi:hypothetical protein